MTVYQELLAAIAKRDPTFHMAKYEAGQPRLRMLVHAINDLAESDWMELSDQARWWFNTAVEAIEKGNAIESPDGDDGVSLFEAFKSDVLH